MAFNVEEIRSALQLGGARPTLFQVTFDNPVNPVADLVKTPFMVRAASIPEATLGNIAIPYFGRIVNAAGDRTYAPWQVTVINDEDFLIRNALEQWSNAINSFQGNLRRFGTGAMQEYQTQAEVIQYGKTGDVLRVYRFNGIYPQAISGIGLDWSTRDTIEEYQVTFVYNYWEIVGGQTGNAGGV